MNREADAGGLAVEALQAAFEASFSPWVRELNLAVIESGSGHVTLTMRPDVRLNRQGGIVSGQALMAAADTAMVLAIWSECRGAIPCATVDMTTSFLKPAINVELTLTASVIRRGRSMAFARVEITSSSDGKPVVAATGTYALPREASQC